MRWPIRNQILIPFVTVVLLAVVAIAAVAATLAARNRDAQTLAQLQNVVATLAHTSVPYTESVLEKMRGLSGGHFVACDSAGQVVASTLPAAESLPRGFAAGVAPGELKSLAGQPTVTLDETRYFIARMEPRTDANVRSLFVLYPEESWSRARWNAAFPPLAVGAGAVLLTSGVSVWLANRFGRRIRRLQAQVASIAAGDFREIASGSKRDEIQELVVSVNSMSAQLRQMQEAIRRTERTRLLAQLAGGLAHQLRNAVAGARMALQLHQRRCTSGPGDGSLAVALRQLALTETQVRGMLSLGRGERSHIADCDLDRLVEEVADLVGPICEHAHVSLDVVVDPPAGFVRADLECLRAAILNLVTNAIEATGAGGDVTVRAMARGECARVEVSDSGPGPDSDVAETLFEPFVTTKLEGVGLGLALARQVALDSGGTLSWNRENGRTVFQLLLPAVETGNRTQPQIVEECVPAHSSVPGG